MVGMLVEIVEGNRILQRAFFAPNTDVPELAAAKVLSDLEASGCHVRCLYFVPHAHSLEEVWTKQDLLLPFEYEEPPEPIEELIL